MKQPIFILGGPTASGKSGLAMLIAKEYDIVIINADSLQIYSHIPLLSAQPSPEEKQAVEHALYEVVPPIETSSVGHWLELAVEAINNAHARGKVPLVVGGTGFYLRTLMHGIAPIPDVPASVREETVGLLHEIGNEAFHQRLAEIDPVMAQKLPVGDTQRMIRAYEVKQATGVSLKEWQEKPSIAPFEEGQCHAYTLLSPREKLYAQCNARFLTMLEQGAIDEVKSLYATFGHEALEGSMAQKALGLREIDAYLQEKCSYEEMIAASQQSTRRYAKRQMTWFRHQMPEAITLNDDDFAQHLSNLVGSVLGSC